MRRGWAAALVLLAGTGPAVPAAAAVPALINFQGRLLRADGTPEAGILAIEFSIHDSFAGGTALWNETQSVGFTDGFYSAMLGSVATLPSSVTAGATRYLAVTVEGVELSPRMQLVSVAFALRAAVADDAELLGGLAASDLAPAAHTHDALYVNVSGDSITGSLSVAGALTTGGNAVWHAGNLRFTSCTRTDSFPAAGYHDVTFAAAECTAGVPTGTCVAAMRSSACGSSTPMIEPSCGAAGTFHYYLTAGIDWCTGGCTFMCF